MVVLVARAVTKLLVAHNPFQGDGYRGVGWFGSLVISDTGSALSDLVGYIATRKPWEMEMAVQPGLRGRTGFNHPLSAWHPSKAA